MGPSKIRVPHQKRTQRQARFRHDSILILSMMNDGERRTFVHSNRSKLLLLKEMDNETLLIEDENEKINVTTYDHDESISLEAQPTEEQNITSEVNVSKSPPPD